jgi:GNAT superfamily N-acetyltransferase
MVTIRPACLADIPTLVEFNQALAFETEGHAIPGATLESGIRRLIERPGFGFYTVAARSGAPEVVIGCTLITFEWSDWRDGIIWWIQSVFVRKDQRGQGVFRALLDHLEKRARQDPEVRGLRLYVEDENHRAHRTYDRLGLVPARYTVRQKLFSDH